MRWDDINKFSSVSVNYGEIIFHRCLQLTSLLSRRKLLTASRTYFKRAQKDESDTNWLDKQHPIFYLSWIPQTERNISRLYLVFLVAYLSTILIFVYTSTFSHFLLFKIIFQLKINLIEEKGV